MESSGVIKKDDGVETVKICRWCLAADDALEALAKDDAGQYKLQQIFDFTRLQINFLPAVPSYLCTVCESRLKKMYRFRWRCNRSNDLVDKFIEQQHTVKNESEIAQDHLDHSAEQTIGIDVSIKTEVTSPDAAKDLHKKCYTVHQANMTYECCGNIPDDLFEAEENPIAIKSESEAVDEQQHTVKNESEIAQDHLDHSAEQTIGTEVSIKTEVTSPDTAKDLHKKCYTVHQANMTYECCGKIPDDLFEAEENPIAIKSEHEEVDEQHQLQTTNDVLDHEQDTQNTNPLESVCQDQNDHPVTVADNTCADGSAAESIQNVSSPGTRNAHSKSLSKKHKHHCPHCSATYPALNKLKIHIRSHTEQDSQNKSPLKSICQDKNDHPLTVADNTCADGSAAESIQNVSSPGTRNAHSKSHSKNHKHHCPHCSATYPALNKLKIHIRSHTGEKPYKCNVCDKAFDSSSHLLQHSKIHNKDQYYQCPHCSSKFAWLSSLKMHIRTHTGEKPYQCKICDKAFSSSTYLARHSKFHKKDQQHQCPHCSSKFTLLSSLKDHIRTHTGEKPYKCYVCDKAFRSSSNLFQHSKIHNKEQHHQCPHCSSKFALLSSLKIHIRSHTGEKPYQCKICDKAFCSSSYLAHHSKIHNKDQQHQCPHCSSKFTCSSRLMIHIRTHTGEKPYKCNVCDKAFRSSTHLTQHSKIHNKEQHHQCPHCSSKFALLSSLKIHIRSHTGEKPYQCKICDKAFRSPSNLFQHSKIHKKDEPH